VAHAEEIAGQVYELGSNKGKLIYNFKNSVTVKDGVRLAKSEYKDLSGQIVATEDSQLKDGKVVSYSVDHKQLEQKASVEVKADRVYFTLQNKDGSQKKDDEKLPSNLVIGPSLLTYIALNWPDINGGKSIRMRFASWERLETVGFEIFKVGEESRGERKVTILTMKPSNFVIAALVKPLKLVVANEGKELVEIFGRTLPKRKDGTKWKDLDAEVYYSTL
jgi:hypothetical protein